MDSRESLVELIFTKCSLVYGREFLGRWEGLRIDDVKADWVHELGPLLDAPQAVRHALMHLPVDGKPPTVLQFRQMCINRPAEHVPALPAPRADVALVAAIVSNFTVTPKDPKGWAHRLRIREQHGERLTITQRAVWRTALQVRSKSEAV